MFRNEQKFMHQPAISMLAVYCTIVINAMESTSTWLCKYETINSAFKPYDKRRTICI